MAETKTATSRAKQPTKRTTNKTFTAEERAAMRERAREAKAAKSRSGKSGREEAEREVLAKIAEMGSSDRAMARRVHALIMATVPELEPRTWYGMPAYAKDGNVVCFFQNAGKFKSRYSMLGFSDKANLDKGAMWPVYFALMDLTADVEKKLAALVKKAAS